MRCAIRSDSQAFRCVVKERISTLLLSHRSIRLSSGLQGEMGCECKVQHTLTRLFFVGLGLLWALFHGFVPLFLECSENLNRREPKSDLSLRVVFVVCSIVIP
jgi:hypothetical protein